MTVYTYIYISIYANDNKNGLKVANQGNKCIISNEHSNGRANWPSLYVYYSNWSYRRLEAVETLRHTVATREHQNISSLVAFSTLQTTIRHLVFKLRKRQGRLDGY